MYVPTGADALIHGCWCEGWGVADRTSGLSGWASVANGGISPNLVVRAFDVTAGTADSTVEIGGRLRVRHVFRPSPRPELYQVDLTVENLGATAADLVYRRAVDWDVPPTRFEEFVTIRGAHPRLLAATDHGFQDVNPFVPLSNLGGIGTFEDLGPGDRGSVFDFTLGVLAPGERTTMTMFFGAAATEADAVAALEAVDAEIYSLGQPSTPDGPTLGTPNTFMFGVTDGAVASGPVIVRGRLMPTRGGGVVNGSVGLYLPRLSDAPSEDTLVATATTASDGTFSLETPLTPALSAAAAATDGQINLDLVANVNGSTYHLAIVRAYVGGAWVDELGNAPTQLVLTPVSGVVNPRLIPNSAGGATIGLPGVRLLCDLPVPDRVGARVDDGRRAAHACRYGARHVHVRPEGRLVHLEGVLTRRIHLVREGIGACGERDGIERLGHHRLLDAGRHVGTRDPDRVRLHEVPNRALVLVARCRPGLAGVRDPGDGMGGELAARC